jgi:DNA polymerase III delta prime subunit
MGSNGLDDLIIDGAALRWLAAYLGAPTQTLLLTGPRGVGLGTIAQALAQKLAKTDVIIIKPTLHDRQKTANINVDDIKGIKKIIQNKRQSPLVVIIDDVDKLTANTPETLLKLLEEPTANVYFVLTTHNMYNLPATIVSRAQVIQLPPTDAADKLLNDVKPPAKQGQIKFMSQGLPAEMIRLIEDEEYFRSHARRFAEIKQFINASHYQRLTMISKIKTRDEAINFVSGLARITALTAVKNANLSLLSDVTERLAKNGNLKAQLTYLANFY